jgi:hypothetical protein
MRLHELGAPWEISCGALAFGNMAFNQAEARQYRVFWNPCRIFCHQTKNPGSLGFPVEYDYRF